MIIFQTAGSGSVAGLGLGKLPAHALPPATTFRTNGYIHRLNRALQAEMRAVSAYGSLIFHGAPSKRPVGLQGHGEDHQLAGKTLIRLIIGNRGIPEDRTVLSLGLTSTWIGFCERMPARLFERATVGTLVSLESDLARRYRSLLREAPLRDAPILKDLLRRTDKRRVALLKDRKRG